MIVRSFIAWFDTAPMHERIEAVQMMAQCYLSGELGSDTPQDAETALTLVLDDPAISVRAALARELTLSARAPRHLIVSLAHDQAEVSSMVLARSPQLTDADLIDCARHGEALTHLAIAMRETVSARVAGVLAEVAGARALCSLLDNSGADLSEANYRHILSRHGGDGALREALNRREDLPADVRQSLVSAVSRDLLAFVRERGWVAERRLDRTVTDARDAATIELAAEAQNLSQFVAHLGDTGQLTPSLLIRSLLTGDTSLLGAALVCLSGVSTSRVAGMLRGRGGSVLAATCVKAGLPRTLVPVFTAALTAIHEQRGDAFSAGSDLKRPIVGKVLAACLMEDSEDMRPVLALLRRYDAELARAEARVAVERLKTDAAPMLEASVAPMIDADAFAAALADETAEEGDLSPIELVEIKLPEPIAAAPDVGAAPRLIEPTHPVASAVDAGRPLTPCIIDPTAHDAAFETPASVPLTSRISRIIRRQQPAPQRRIDDIEALFDEMFRDERALHPLRVAGTQSQPYDAQPSNDGRKNASRAA